jgi:hypothetical protein
MCLEQLQSASSDLSDEPHTCPEYQSVIRCIDEQLRYWEDLKTHIEQNSLSERESSAVMRIAPLVNDETDFLSMVVSARQFIGSSPDEITQTDLEECQRRLNNLEAYYEALGAAGVLRLPLSH